MGVAASRAHRLQQVLAFRFGDQGQDADRLMAVGQGCLQKHLEMGAHAFDRRLVKQLGIIRQDEDQPGSFPVGDQRQIVAFCVWQNAIQDRQHLSDRQHRP